MTISRLPYKMLLTSVLLWFHIFAAVGWLGAAMVFAMLIGPTIGTFTPGTRSEVVLKLFPKYVRYTEVFAIMTVLFGAALALSIANGDMNVLSPSTHFGLFILSGASLAIIVVALAFGFIAPTAHRVVHLTEEMVKNPGPPPAELLRASSRLRAGASVGLILLILVLVFMVGSVSG